MTESKKQYMFHFVCKLKLPMTVQSESIFATRLLTQILTKEKLLVTI